MGCLGTGAGAGAGLYGCERLEDGSDGLALGAAQKCNVHMAAKCGRAGRQGQQPVADEEERSAHEVTRHRLHDGQQRVVVKVEQGKHRPQGVLRGGEVHRSHKQVAARPSGCTRNKGGVVQSPPFTRESETRLDCAVTSPSQGVGKPKCSAPCHPPQRSRADKGAPP